MAYRNHRIQYNGYGNQRHNYGNQRNRTNVTQNDGTYPPHEISQARDLINYQYHNHNSRAMRTLRQMMYNTRVDFFHKQQNESVIPASFGAVQEEAEGDVERIAATNQDSDDDDIGSSNRSSKRKNIQKDIDIHTVEETDMFSDTQNSTAVSQSSSKSKSLKSATVTSELNDNDGPPTKRQRLSNDSSEVVVVDSNGNIDNDSVLTEDFVILDNVGYTDNSNDSADVVIDGEGNIVISSDEEDREASSDTEEEIQTELCLMCDLCLHIISGSSEESKQEMKTHLKTTNHSAASLIEAKKDGDKLIPRYVEEKHYLSNFNELECDILPICPECNQIHANVWVCALHYQQKHDKNEENTYGLGKVVHRDVCKVSCSHCCQKCRNTFSTASKLHKHWKNQHHFPFKQPSSNQIIQFKCEECNFKDLSFLTCRAHVLSIHATKLRQTDIEMSILYLERTKKLTLLPRKSSYYEQVLKENKKLVKRAIKEGKIKNRKQKRRMRKSVLPTTEAMVEYKYGKNHNEDKDRYEKYLKNYVNYERYHFSQKS